MLITGGAGFIGTNLARPPARDGRAGPVFDNLSRAGRRAEPARGCASSHGDRVELQVGDVRDRARRRRGGRRRRASVFHFAAQVAVTTSLPIRARLRRERARHAQRAGGDPRAARSPPPLLFTSTNKVYGAPRRRRAREPTAALRPADAALARHGIAEARPLDFHSPYGCSKGAADQYVLDYARTLRPAGGGVPHELHLRPAPVRHRGPGLGRALPHPRARAASRSRIYGDGMQVRDILFVEDLVDAMLLVAHEHVDRGSRAKPSTSAAARREHDQPARAARPDRRARRRAARGPLRAVAAGDQRYYVSDTAKFRAGDRLAAATSASARASALLLRMARLASSDDGRRARVAAAAGWRREVRARQPALDVRRQHLLRLPRAAPAARVRLRQGAARAGGPRGG